MSRKKFIAGFIVGFTIWIPFLLLAYDLSPMHLTIESSVNTIVGPYRIPMWGWTWDAFYKPNVPGVIEGAYTGLFTLPLFYILYFCLVILFYLPLKWGVLNE